MAQRQWRSDDTDPWKEAFGDAAVDVIKTTNETASPANATCTGTASTKALSLGAASTFANNDIVLIHQTQKATGAGVWELNRIVSGAGTTSLIMKYDLMNTYAANAQIVGAIMAKNYTINTGVTVTLPAWDGAKGGIYFVIAKNAISVVGTINAAGLVGSTGGAVVAGGAGIGFRGGASQTGYADSGEGTPRVGANELDANGNGGAGSSGWQGHAAGGGNGTAGANGPSNPGGTPQGGLAVGNAGLTIMDLGGGGGAAAGGTTHGSGGGGGGIVVLIGKIITITGAINLAGGAGIDTEFDGGGGAGGSCLLKAQEMDLGTNLITALGGEGHTAGDGGVGRIHADYSKTLSGTTSPSLDYTLDVTIKAGGSAPRVVNFN